MKNIIGVGCFLLLPSMTIWSQQLTQYTNFVFNYQLVNPAAIGYTTCTEFKSTYRQQWAGIQGAPKTTNALVHARLRANRNAFQGIGAVVETDQAGAFGGTGFTLNYSYHTRFTKGYNLAAGIGLGFMQYRIDYTKLNFQDPLSETAITNTVNDYIIPNINMGFWLYRGDRFYGLAIKSITNSKVEGTQATKYNRHYTLSYGKYIKVSKDLAFKPSFMFRWVRSTRPAIDAQLLLSYKKAFSIGFAARNGHGFSALIKMELLDQITIGYAYDVTLNKLRYGSYSTHEICLGIRTCAVLGKEKALCAAYD